MGRAATDPATARVLVRIFKRGAIVAILESEIFVLEVLDVRVLKTMYVLMMCVSLDMFDDGCGLYFVP
jgi:hypothetical protein